jgi:hypothetical protein
MVTIMNHILALVAVHIHTLFDQGVRPTKLYQPSASSANTQRIFGLDVKLREKGRINELLKCEGCDLACWYILQIFEDPNLDPLIMKP